MKKFFASIVAPVFSIVLMAQKPALSVNGDNGLRTEVIVYDNSIIRIVKYPSSLTQAPTNESFSVILTPKKCNVAVSANSLETGDIIVAVDNHGKVTFKNKG